MIVGSTSCGVEACLTVNILIIHAFKPESSDRDAIVVDITIENRLADADVAYEVGQFTLVDAERFAYAPIAGAGSPPLADGEVPAGLKVRGQILFDVLEGAQVTELRWENPRGGELTVSLRQ